MRFEINKSNQPNNILADKFNVSENTINKWKNRNSFEDKSSRPSKIHYSLSELQMLITVELRVIAWWALDEITEAVNPVEPEKNMKCCLQNFCT